MKHYHYSRLNHGGKLSLQVTFYPNKMRYLLKKAHQVIWGDERPLTLLWLSIPSATQRQVLSDEMDHPIRHTLKAMATARGLPILFPILDLEDQDHTLLSGQTVLPTESQMQYVLKRYGVDTVLAGAITFNAAHHIECEWILFLNGKPYEWQTSASDMSQVLKNGLDRAVEMMAIQLQIEKHNRYPDVLLQVYGVYTLHDYVHVLSKLKHLAPVTNVSIRNMTGDTISLKITTVGGVMALVNALKSASHFASASAPTDIGSHMNALFYQWKAAPAQPERASF